MFDNYNDPVTISYPDGMDNFNHPTYKEKIKTNLRFIKAVSTYEIGTKSVGTTLTQIYHSPKEIPIKSKIDTYTVYECKPIRGITGKIEYYKVWCK